MLKIFINYADTRFYNAQKVACEAAMVHCFDEVIPYSRINIDDTFLENNRTILDQPRGAGYWLWKPYFILRTLNTMKFGDYLCYADSGTVFIDNVNHLISTLESSGQDIMPFDLHMMIERTWTKRDVFLYNDVDVPEITDTNICDASVQLVKKTEFSIRFYEEYLRQSCIEHLITDSPNILGKPNYPEFIDHRHDQSIFSVNVKKNKLITFRTASQYGNGLERYYQYSNYPQVINHHRNAS